MVQGQADFREALAAFPNLRALPREKLVKAVYLRDRRSLPDELKRLYESAKVIQIPVGEPEDVARAIGVANGSVASVNLGLAADALHYARTRLFMLKDRELSVDWRPKSDPFDAEILPQLDGFVVDLSELREVAVDDENGIVRCGVGSRWKEVYEHCRSRGWVFPLFPLLPIDHYVGDVVANTTTLVSYRGGPETCVRNVDFLTPEARYGESGFDQVPSNAAGYDLTSLMLGMGRHVGIPVSVTFALQSSSEDCRTLRFAPKDLDGLVKGVTALSSTKVNPLKVVFGEDTASKLSLGASEGYAVEITIQGTDETLAAQDKVITAALGEGVKKEVVEGISHPLTGGTPRVQPSPILEIRTSIGDSGPLMQALLEWKESQGPSIGLLGFLVEGRTVGLMPMSVGTLGRGERFDRLLELVQLARNHRCSIRSNPLLQLLEPESNLQKRFDLVRKIKAEVDRPNVINPSGVLWVPGVI